MSFADRADAGRQLAQRLRGSAYARPVVIGLPRGGVPVARAVADVLHAPLDVIVVRKIGAPGREELGMGAAAEDDVLVFNEEIRQQVRLPQEQLDAVVTRAREAITTRLAAIRAVRPAMPLQGCTAIIVDDGIATGIDARAACRVARARGAARVVLAVPVAPEDWRHRLAGEADEFIAVEEPPDFMAVGEFYEDFSQTSDEEVLQCLR